MADINNCLSFSLSLPLSLFFLPALPFHFPCVRVSFCVRGSYYRRVYVLSDNRACQLYSLRVCLRMRSKLFANSFAAIKRMWCPKLSSLRAFAYSSVYMPLCAMCMCGDLHKATRGRFSRENGRPWDGKQNRYIWKERRIKGKWMKNGRKQKNKVRPLSVFSVFNIIKSSFSEGGKNLRR